MPTGRGGGTGLGRLCTVCTHPQRDDMDAALLHATGYRKIAEGYGLAGSPPCTFGRIYLAKDGDTSAA
jgi:hypothetical protein